MVDLLVPATFVEKSVEAVRSVLGQPSRTIALHEPQFAGREWEYVKDCLDSGWVSSVGDYVDRFERNLVEYTGAHHAVATSNGTSALHIALLLCGVRPGDEVLMPALTFIATANAVSYTGATPHFVDSETRSLGVDAERLEAHLSEIAVISNGNTINRRTGARIGALVIVHVFGHPCDICALSEVARRWALPLVEDAAESLGSTLKGRHTGNFGLVSALSFNGNKVITTGGGGAILTNSSELGWRAKHLTTTARVPHRWSFIHDEVGYNYRLPNINAALGCAQIEQLPQLIENKRNLAALYRLAFSLVPGATFIDEPAGARSNYWLCSILLDQENKTDRDDLLAALNEAGYASRPIWTLMHRLPMYAKCPRMSLEVAESLEARVINLPSSSSLGRIAIGSESM